MSYTSGQSGVAWLVVLVFATLFFVVVVLDSRIDDNAARIDKIEDMIREMQF